MALSQEEKDRRKQERRYKKWNEAHLIIDGEDYKYCNKCNEYHPASADYFYPNKSNSIDGLNPYCIEQTIIKSEQWALENPERRKELKNKYNQRDYIIERRRQSTKLRKELGKEKEWHQKNPHKASMYSKDKQLYRTHDITDEEWINCKQYFDNSCAYCGLNQDLHLKNYKGKPKLYDLHREHVDDKGANDLSNCIPSCHMCNSEKWEFEFDEWYSTRNMHYSVERHDKIIRWLTNDYKLFIQIPMK